MINDNNYYIIFAWMHKKLNLRGSELLVYAVIYSFTQDGKNWFTGGLKYICNLTALSKQTVIKTLKSLVEKKLIIKASKRFNNVWFTAYQINLPVVKKLDCAGQENLPEGSKNFTEGGQESLPNNKEYNKDIFNTFIPPTKEEVASYVKSNWLRVDAEHFVDYYTSNGWIVGRAKMRDWKAAVRSWHRNAISRDERNGIYRLQSKPSYDIDEIERRAIYNDDYDV